MTDRKDLSLLETLDHLLDKGVVIAGEATISIAEVDLIALSLSIVLGNVDRVLELGGSRNEGDGER